MHVLTTLAKCVLSKSDCNFLCCHVRAQLTGNTLQCQRMSWCGYRALIKYHCCTADTVKAVIEMF